VIVRLLEARGKPATCRLALSVPSGVRITAARSTTVLETGGEPLPVSDQSVEVRLRANEIVTVRLEIKLERE
jgi:hypothetical protein